MKRYAPLAILLLATVFFATTGFQCGSAEATSAKLYMQQKQFDKAEASLVKALQKNDKDEESWFLLGQVRLELKRYKEMNEAYTHALQISDAHKAEINRNRLAVWGMMYNDGVKFFNGGRDDASNYDKALDAFSVAIDMEPDSVATYYVAGLGHHAKKDYDKAIGVLETALQKKPNFPEAARFLGQVHYQKAQDILGNPAYTSSDTSKEAKQKKQEVEAAAKSEFLLATDGFEKAYKFEPDSVVNITNLIDVYERTNNSEKATTLTKDAVAKDPKNKFYHYAYGVFELKQEKYANAVDQFQKALEIDPNYADARYNIGVSYLNWGIGLRKEAVDKAEAAQKKLGKGKQVKLEDTYAEKFKLSLPYLEKSAELRSDDATLWMKLGQLYAILNMSDKSKAAFEKADKLNK